jgi:enoyl-CoA hydratase
MEKSNAVLVETYGETAVVIFNRPSIRSPLSVFVVERLREILCEIANGEQFARVVFTGRENVFASGADLKEIASVNKDTAREFAKRGQNLMNQIADLEQETVAAINGFCFGGALDLAVACDRRIAAPEAVFCHPGASLGIITGWSGTQRLPKLIGEARALELFLTTKQIPAAEALRINLIDRISENPLEDAI